MMDKHDAKALINHMLAEFLMLRASWDMAGASSLGDNPDETFGKALDNLESQAFRFTLKVSDVAEVYRNAS